MKRLLPFICLVLLVGCESRITPSEPIVIEQTTLTNYAPVLPTDNFITKTMQSWRDIHPNTYQDILQALMHYDTTYHFSPSEIHPDDVMAIVEAIADNNRYDVPLKKWGVRYTNIEGELTFTYKLPYDELMKRKTFVDQQVQSIIANEVPSNATEYERVKALHDYVVLNTAYDVTTYENCDAINCENVADPYSAYGLFANQIAVCSGYTGAFTALLDAAGIENYVVTGTAKGVGHAWNIVKVDGQYYHVDTTWDDPVPDRPNEVQYDYFLKPNGEMYDHSWKPDDFPPVAKEAYPH